MNIWTSSVRKTAQILSKLYPVSKTSVWNWVKKFEQKLPIIYNRREKRRNLIDETIVKVNRNKYYYVYSATDIERNKLILMGFYTTRNYLTTKSFIKEVLKLCENKQYYRG